MNFPNEEKIRSAVESTNLGPDFFVNALVNGMMPLEGREFTNGGALVLSIQLALYDAGILGAFAETFYRGFLHFLENLIDDPQTLEEAQERWQKILES